MNRVIFGDCRDVMRDLIKQGVKVQMAVTSPPYWGLRDYGVAGQLGLESTPEEYIETMVGVFGLVRELLADDGVLFLNLGDSYFGSWQNYGGGSRGAGKQRPIVKGSSAQNPVWDGLENARPAATMPHPILKPKDLVGIPWRVAFALQQPYRDWQIKTEAMRAWVGGIVDGEGCITIMETKSSHSESLSYPPIIQVRMCDLEPLDRLVQVVGSSYGKPQHPPSQVAANQRPSWQWKVVSEQAANVIAEIYPFLTCKRKQAIVAWNHQAFRSARGNQARARGDIEKEQFCKTLINSLNQRQPVDIPSWMKEPTIQYEPGWYLRQDLIWAKPNPMPESVTDRCTKAHEYIFLLSKSERYYFDNDAIKEDCVQNEMANGFRGGAYCNNATFDNADGGKRKTRGNYKTPDGWDTSKGEGGHGSFHKNGREKGAVRLPGNKSHKGTTAYEAGAEEHRTKAGLVKYAENMRSARDSFRRTDSKRAAIIPGQSVGTHRPDRAESEWDTARRNKRSVWTIATQPYKEAHFATFPKALVEPCVLAGSRPGDIVFDPFLGSGTTAEVAEALGRQWIGIELNREYEPLQKQRTAQMGMTL